MVDWEPSRTLVLDLVFCFRRFLFQVIDSGACSRSLESTDARVAMANKCAACARSKRDKMEQISDETRGKTLGDHG